MHPPGAGRGRASTARARSCSSPTTRSARPSTAPDAAERWAANLDRILRATDERHWLVWTSRPAPLRAGLRRLHRERGAERFPQPGGGPGRRVRARRRGEDPDPVPPRARGAPARRARATRSATHGADDRRAPALHARADPPLRRARRARSDGIERELSEPTDGDGGLLPRRSSPSTASCCWRCSTRRPGPVAERDLAAALRRHADERPAEGARRPRRPARRPLPAGDRMRVDWVHPSWRDLVIEELAADAERAPALPLALRRRRRRGRAASPAAPRDARAPAAARRRRLGRARRRPAPPVRRARRGRGGAAARRARRRRRGRRGARAGRARAAAAGLERQGGQRRRDRRLGRGLEVARPAPRRRPRWR